MKRGRLTLRPEAFREAPSLQGALVDLLFRLQDDIVEATDGLVRLRVLEPLVVEVKSNTPGNAPWPLRLAQVARSPLGATLLTWENLTTQGAAGVSTTAVAITGQRVEAETVFVDFVSGLALSSRYRLRFGVYDAS